MRTEGQPSPDEVLKNTQTRAASDRQLINDGADANFNAETGKVEISPTDQQVERMANEDPRRISTIKRKLIIIERVADLLGYRYEYVMDHIHDPINRAIAERKSDVAEDIILKTTEMFRKNIDDQRHSVSEEKRTQAKEFLDEMSAIN